MYSCIKIFFKHLLLVFLVVFLSAGCGFCEQDNLPAQRENTITLKRAVEIALQNNRTLQRSRLNLASSNLSVKAQNDNFKIKVIPSTVASFNTSTDQYWSAGVKLSKKTRLGVSSSITPQIERFGDSYQSSVNVLLNVPLLRGLGTDYNLDGLYSSLYDLESSKRSHYQQQNTIVIDTVTTVYTIIKLQKQSELLDTQIDSLAKHIALTRVKEKIGLASAMDMYRAELRLKEVQNESTTIREQFESHVDQLKNLLALSMQGDLTVTAPIDYKPIDVPLEEAVAIALDNRIEMEQSLRRNEESKRKMLIAKNTILPIVDLNMGYKKYGDNSSFLLDEEDWVISLNGSSDLFRSAEKTAFEQANISFRQSKIDLESTREQIVREVRGQINQMKKTQTLIGDRRKQARQAEGKMELAVSKFNHQLADNFDLLEAQSQMQQVQSDLLFDTIGYIVDTYRLRSVLGTLIEREKGTL